MFIKVWMTQAILLILSWVPGNTMIMDEFWNTYFTITSEIPATWQQTKTYPRLLQGWKQRGFPATDTKILRYEEEPTVFKAES